ncbi:MAG: hypothetical protein H7323_12910 [Frankiales bacterium]|nr:hypothetical protein [Frankiales bacterium]
MRIPGRTPAAPRATKKVPLYPRLLRLRHVHPNAWQRAAVGEGALAVAVLLVLADLASAWTLLALPAAVAVIVKAHDVLAGLLTREPASVPTDANGAAPDQGSGADGGGRGR